MNKEIEKFINQINNIDGEPQVDFATHKPTEEELNNLCYLSFKHIIAWHMRATDYHIVRMMGGDPQTVDELKEKFIPELAQYIWDHMMGEPEDPTSEDITKAIVALCDFLFKMNESIRNDVKESNEPID